MGKVYSERKAPFGGAFPLVRIAISVSSFYFSMRKVLIIRGKKREAFSRRL